MATKSVTYTAAAKANYELVGIFNVPSSPTSDTGIQSTWSHLTYSNEARDTATEVLSSGNTYYRHLYYAPTCSVYIGLAETDIDYSGDYTELTDEDLGSLAASYATTDAYAAATFSYYINSNQKSTGSDSGDGGAYDVSLSVPLFNVLDHITNGTTTFYVKLSNSYIASGKSEEYTYIGINALYPAGNRVFYKDNAGVVTITSFPGGGETIMLSPVFISAPTTLAANVKLTSNVSSTVSLDEASYDVSSTATDATVIIA